MPYRVIHDKKQGGWFVETIPTGRRLSKKPFKSRKEAEAQKKAVEINEFGKSKEIEAQMQSITEQIDWLRSYLDAILNRDRAPPP